MHVMVWGGGVASKKNPDQPNIYLDLDKYKRKSQNIFCQGGNTILKIALIS